MSWIDIKDSSPNDGDFCWIHLPSGKILQAIYDDEPPKFRFGERDDHFVWENQITHWMLYYTPEPPSEVWKLKSMADRSEGTPGDL